MNIKSPELLTLASFLFSSRGNHVYELTDGLIVFVGQRPHHDAWLPCVVTWDPSKVRPNSPFNSEGQNVMCCEVKNIWGDHESGTLIGLCRSTFVRADPFSREVVFHPTPRLVSFSADGEVPSGVTCIN